MSLSDELREKIVQTIRTADVTDRLNYYWVTDDILALIAEERVKSEVAQQTITQLTRELETARKVLEPFAAMAQRYDHREMHVLGWTNFEGKIVYVRPQDFKAAASFLSSLSHQDEQG